MRVLKKAIYPTVAELEEHIAQRKRDLAAMSPSHERQSVLDEIRRLRSYADMKRLLAPQSAGAIRSASATGPEFRETRALARKSELN